MPTGLNAESKKFFDFYELSGAVYCNDELNTPLKAKTDRVCRFCQKSMPGVRFTSRAHVVPRFTGNEKWLSDFECDDCNQLFSTYENDLANFLGMSRTMFGMKGRYGIPKLKGHGDNNLVVMPVSSKIENAVWIYSEDASQVAMEFDWENCRAITTMTKQPYIPINVYKSLVKIAMSMMPEEEMLYFKHTFRFLVEKDFHKRIDGIGKAYVQIVNLWYEQPMLYLFRRQNTKEEIPTYIFAIQIKNYFIQIIVPLYEIDLPIFSGRPMEIRFSPAFVCHPPQKEFTCSQKLLVELDDDILRKGEEENFISEFTLRDSSAKIVVNHDKIVAVKIVFGSS